MTDYVYRVTRVRKNPQYYQSKNSVKVCTRKSMLAQLKMWQQQRDWAIRCGRPVPEPEIVKIEKAPIGEYEDVTKEIYDAISNTDHG